MSWKESVNRSPQAAVIADVNTLVTTTNVARESPIDTFYQKSLEILATGTPDQLAQHPSLGSLLLVGIVSATENYFRDAFSRVIRMCPVAKSASADQNVKLGSVVWLGGLDLERGAFEAISFASSEAITTSARKFLNFNMPRMPILDEFEKVCQIRHAIVHSGGTLAGKNAIQLGLSVSGQDLRINIGFAQLQECANVCHSLVVNTNKELFTEISRRWAIKWPSLAGWNANNAHRAFMRIWDTFHSIRDSQAGTIPDSLTSIRCRNKIRIEYP